MAYRILYGSEVVWEPYSDSKDAVTDVELSMSVNAAKYLDFTMPPTHSLYNKIAERSSTVWVYADKKVIYKGFISNITTDIYGYKSVSCTSVMNYLGDTHVRDYSTISGEQTLTAPSTLNGLFQWYIDQHNSRCLDPKKKFKIGVNEADLLDPNNYVYRSSTQFPTTSEEIENKILDSGGYIFERYEGNDNILDIYADAHEANTQILDFGVNITDFTRETSTEDQYTAVYATGYTPDPPKNNPDKEMKPISLANIPDGTSKYGADLYKRGDVLYSVSAVQRYGYREYYYTNEDITNTDNLLRSAGIVLNKLLSPSLTLDVKAVDMALFSNNGYEHLQLGQAVRVRSKPHNTDEYLMISAINLDLQDPGNTSYTIGTSYDTLTGQQSSYLKSLNAGINSSLDSVAALDKATKENAKGVDEAKKDAATATSKANEANTKADAATETANSASSKANEANAKADAATDTANSANAKADEAKTDAANASSKADEANTKSDTATETANTASQNAQKANEFAKKAKEDAAAAISNANNAVTEAGKATELANSANTKSEQATDLANSAKQAASTASSIASEAKKTAENAKAEAEEGVAAAKDAASKAQAAADKAQADANANTKAVAQAQSTADAAKKAAADAQEKAENVESNLESANAVIEQHSNKLGELSTKVSNAVTNADAALTASTEAKQTATEASTTANTAYKDSQTAITNSTKATQTATEAKTTAESAVTTANDSLKQSSSAVQTANRIQNTLTTDYQTKADSDLLYATKSSLTETSESIKMEVSANYATKSTVEALQNVADNAIESWRGSGVPTSENKPASDWTTTEEKKRHSGDLYYDKDTGKAYRWGSDDGVVYSWVLNQDTDITKALQDASNAQKSADNAQTTANGAVTAAGNAQKSADGAQSTADSAKTAAANAQQTADSVQTDVDQLKIDIPNTYATKASLETTANSITAQVESVSTTANSAVTAASKAQQTADAINVNLTKNYQTKENADNTYATKASLTATSESLSTSITKAQQTADGAVNAASNAQQTADAININLTKNYQTTKDADDKYATQTSLNATADSITSTVSKTYATKTEVTNAVDNISVGGRNLLLNSANVSASFPEVVSKNEFGISIEQFKKVKSVDLFFSCRIQMVDFVYTSRVGFEISFGEPPRFWGVWYYEGHDGVTKNNVNKRIYFLNKDCTVPDDFDGLYEKNCYIQGGISGTCIVSDCKLEIGNKPTDWTPAPEDVDASIGNLANTVETTYSTKSEVKQLSDQISSTVTEVTTVKNDLSAAKKVADDAASAASKAQQTANEAKTDAATAQTAADTAKSNAATAQSKADEAAKNLAAAEENLNNLQNQADATDEQVAAAKAAVENAKKAADQAQTDATTAKNAAATAQSTADTAKANAKTAQDTADTAKANAKTAQDDVNALKNRVTSAETSIKQNSDAIALRATKTEVTSAIDGISVGGRNLFYRTKETPVAKSNEGNVGRNYNSFQSNFGDGGSLTKTSDGLRLVFGSDENVSIQVPLAEFGNVENDDIVTLSFTYRGNISSFGVFYFLQKIGTSINVKGFPSLNGDGSWHKYNHTFSNSQANVRTCVSCLLFYYNSQYDNSKWIEIKAGTLKLEKGNKSTDWSPAPEDLQKFAKTYTDAQLKIASESITSTVSKTYSTKAELTSAIDGINIGGRNMLRGSSFKGLSQVDNTYQKFKNNSVKLVCDNVNGTSIKYVAIPSLKESWVLSDVVGRTITISMWIYIEKVGQLYGYEFRIVYADNGTKYLFNPDKNYPYYIPNAKGLNQGWNYVYGSFTIPISATEAYFNFTCYSEVGKSGLAWFSSPKAEIGNKATTWTPAPEDADASIDGLTTRMTSAETKIEQNSEAISLRATKTEVTKVKNTADTAKANAKTAQDDVDTVKNDLATNYVTTTKYESGIKVLKDSITSEVSKTYATSEEVKQLKNIADGAIETWSGTVDPTASNAPASSWDTPELKKQHSGDMYYNTTTGIGFRWTPNSAGTSYSWTQIRDTGVSKALQDAANAQSTANSATQGIEDINTNLTNNYVTNSKLTQTSDSITSTVAKTYQTISGMTDYAKTSEVNQTINGIETRITTITTTANDAKTAATNAEETANSANTAATAANKTAAEAKTAASNAQTAATNSASSAATAASSASTAATKASNAETKAKEAATSASNANDSATSAATSASNAEKSASTASTNATAAAKSASDAKTAADAAATKATNAASSASSAQTAATNSANSASASASSASSAADSAKNAAADAASAKSTAQKMETLIRDTADGVEVAKLINGEYTSTKTLMGDDGFYVKDKDGINLTQIKGSQAIIGKENESHLNLSGNNFAMFSGDTPVMSLNSSRVSLRNGNFIFNTYKEGNFNYNNIEASDDLILQSCRNYPISDRCVFKTRRHAGAGSTYNDIEISANVSKENTLSGTGILISAAASNSGGDDKGHSSGVIILDANSVDVRSHQGTSSLDVYGNISGKSTPGQWLNGKNTAKAVISNNASHASGEYSPFAFDELTDYYWNIGCINNTVGVYAFKKDRTANGVDYKFEFNVASNQASINGIPLITQTKWLWDGTSNPRYMSAEHKVTLSENVTSQPNGIILCWCGYSGGKRQDYNFSYTFVPKMHVEQHPGCGLWCLVCDSQRGGWNGSAITSGMTAKYVYVNNNTITGHAGNHNSDVTNDVVNKTVLFGVLAV